MPQIAWTQSGLLLVEALSIASLVLYLFHGRPRWGLAPLAVAVGALQPLQVLFASAVYVEVWPGFAVSPGSAVLFPGTLLAILLVYIYEDASEVRTLIAGVVVANVLASLLLQAAGFQLSASPTDSPFNLTSGLFQQNVRVMMVGTLVLIADAILIIVVYELLHQALSRARALHVFLSMLAVLSFDTAAFVWGSFLGEPGLGELLVSGIVGKGLMAIVYSLALTLYLASAAGASSGESREVVEAGTGKLDPFRGLSYRQRYEAAREQALRDPLTGLNNRGFFDEILPLTLERARRAADRTTLLMIDLEGFKAINDSRGHLAGDGVLRRFADLLRRAARAEDVVCRFGGDEFALIARHGDEPAAGHLIDRLEKALADEAAADEAAEQQPLPGVTVGYATFPEEAETAEGLIELADRRLYERRGKR